MSVARTSNFKLKRPKAPVLLSGILVNSHDLSLVLKGLVILAVGLNCAGYWTERASTMMHLRTFLTELVGSLVVLLNKYDDASL